jgi:xylan 1,4-beta-xylosidase
LLCTGYITSDCDADAFVYSQHHYKNHTPEQVVADVLHAGTDVDCNEFGPSFVAAHAGTALGNGTISLADVEARLLMQFKVRLRLGHFDPLSPLDAIDEREICSDHAIATSMQGAIQSAALLKNVGGVLPFDAAVAAGQIAVIGPLALYSEENTGYYGPHNCCNKSYWTAVDAVQRYAVKPVSYAAGVPAATSTNTSQIAVAVKAAAAADTVVLVVGTDLIWAAEGHDAVNITFTDAQLQLIDATAVAAKRPIVVLLLTATPLDLSALLANPKIGAVLHVGQPSVTMLGVAELLYGKVSPSGRTVQTVYPASYQDQISIFDFNMRPGPSTFARPDCTNKTDPAACPRGINPGRTHRFYTGDPVVPFGFGLSYTSFNYTVASAPLGRVSLGPVRIMLEATAAAGRLFPALLGANELKLMPYSINVTNTGNVAADDVVLGFIKPPGAGVAGVPLQTLYAFERIHLRPGETQTVDLFPSLLDLTVVDLHGVRRVVSGEYTFMFGVQKTAVSGGGFVEHTVATI